MSAAEIAAYATLVLAIGTAVAGVVTAARMRKVEEHVNSAASASVKKIEELQKEVTDLLKGKADDRQTAALLAQAVVLAEAVVAKAARTKGAKS